MRLDQSKYYRMPLALGPVFDRRMLKLAYPRIEVLAFQYLTDPDALADLLPDCFRPGKEPLVTVVFSRNNGLGFMAGGGYASAAVHLCARFDGDQDHLEGDYIAVMFEDETWPIISDREDLGIPALYAGISHIKMMADGHLRCEASLGGHMLFGLDIPPLKSQIGVMRALTARQINSRLWLGYKYIPSLDGPADVAYPTLIHTVYRLEKLWLGKKASLRFGFARYEDIGAYKNLLDALATLTIIRPLQVLHFTGSAVQRYDLVRRLK